MEDEILPTLRELSIGFVAYSPLGRRFLSGQWKSFEDLSEDDTRRDRFPRFQKQNLEKNLELVERVREIADEKGATPGQLALAWVLHQDDDVVPIPGTKPRKPLEENAAAADIALTNGDLASI